MLATEITNLASGRITWVARRLFTAVVGIQMLTSGIAITACWHKTEMNVISWLNALVCCVIQITSQEKAAYGKVQYQQVAR